MSKKIDVKEFMDEFAKHTEGSTLFKQQPKKVQNDSWVADTIRVIQECRAMNQGMRFGQLIYNVLAKSKPDWTQEDFHQLIFYIEDYDLVKLIEKYGKTGEL